MTKPVVTLEVAKQILERLQKGERKVFLAEEYNVSLTTLYNIEHKQYRFKNL